MVFRNGFHDKFYTGKDVFWILDAIVKNHCYPASRLFQKRHLVNLFIMASCCVNRFIIRKKMFKNNDFVLPKSTYSGGRDLPKQHGKCWKIPFREYNELYWKTYARFITRQKTRLFASSIIQLSSKSRETII